MIQRVLSGIIALVYLVGAFVDGGAEGVVSVAIFLILPLACIWFSDEMGSYTGVMRGHHVTAETPGCFVAFGGWILLFLPVIAAVIAYRMKR